MGVFGYIGILLAAYGCYGAGNGRIYANMGLYGRVLCRTDEPFLFWCGCLSYLVGGGALIVAAIMRPA